MNGPQRVGPVSQDQLCDLFRKGVLTLQTLVWSDAFKNWTEASKIAALRSLAPMPIESTNRVGPGATPSADVPFGGRSISAPSLNYETPNAVNGPVGIGGWLILPAIGLILAPIGQALIVLGAFALAHQQSTAPAAAAAFQKFAIINAIYGVYILIAAFMFFGKKRIAPAMMICAYLAGILLCFMSSVLAGPISSTATNSGSDGAALGRSVIVALIWIPYFSMSKRVKNTFVN
jgi:hypothetical protein